jgi:hypothetical protein
MRAAGPAIPDRGPSSLPLWRAVCLDRRYDGKHKPFRHPVPSREEDPVQNDASNVHRVPDRTHRLQSGQHCVLGAGRTYCMCQSFGLRSRSRRRNHQISFHPGRQSRPVRQLRALITMHISFPDRFHGRAPVIVAECHEPGNSQVGAAGRSPGGARRFASTNLQTGLSPTGGGELQPGSGSHFLLAGDPAISGFFSRIPNVLETEAPWCHWWYHHRALDSPGQRPYDTNPFQNFR